jgi:hypothetical protein
VSSSQALLGAPSTARAEKAAEHLAKQAALPSVFNRPPVGSGRVVDVAVPGAGAPGSSGNSGAGGSSGGGFGGHSISIGHGEIEWPAEGHSFHGAFTTDGERPVELVRGTYRAAGEYYTGGFGAGGEFQGEGTLVAQGEAYCGGFAAGQYSGAGVLRKRGKVYSGGFRGGQRHGLVAASADAVVEPAASAGKPWLRLPWLEFRRHDETGGSGGEWRKECLQQESGELVAELDRVLGGAGAGAGASARAERDRAEYAEFRGSLRVPAGEQVALARLLAADPLRAVVPEAAQAQAQALALTVREVGEMVAERCRGQAAAEERGRQAELKKKTKLLSTYKDSWGYLQVRGGPLAAVMNRG